MSMERKRGILGGLLVMLALSVSGHAWSQDPMIQQPPHTSATQAPTDSPAPTSTPPPPKKTAKKKGKQAANAASQTPVANQAPATSAMPAPTAAAAAPSEAPQVSESAAAATSAPVSAPPAPKLATSTKKGKQPYTGPTTLLESPETPMLDEEGKQRFDPEGKPMFNPPVKQLRDKKGHPEFDANGRPVFQTATDLGYDESGKKIKAKKVKEARTTSLEISKGTLTVDGMIGKAALNYQIKDFKFVYLYAPWIGTVVVSNRSFPGAKEQQKAFDEHTLTVVVEDHQFQLYSEKVMLGKKPEPAYVAVDRQFKLDTKYPAMGYGKSVQAPYSWPSAKRSPESKAYVKPPPVPQDLRQTMMLAACPDGQMRPSPKSPGGPPQACVPMDVPSPANPPADGSTPTTEVPPTAATGAPASSETTPPPPAAPSTPPSITW